MPLPCGRVENPRLARTVDEVPTDLPSRRETRPPRARTAAAEDEICDQWEGGSLDLGNLELYTKLINVDSGKFMAVKILERPTRASKQRRLETIIALCLKA